MLTLLFLHATSPLSSLKPDLHLRSKMLVSLAALSKVGHEAWMFGVLRVAINSLYAIFNLYYVTLFMDVYGLDPWCVFIDF
jgi:hypothetical protein